MQVINERPIASVYVTTYYHEKYIRQAIESILTQKTNFSIQIVISDDCSQDGTPDILREYASKYDFIKINLNEKNLGLTSNMFLAKSLCDGKYISDLSGDDYWIDDYKLQKQVDFLEKNPDYYAVCNRVEARPDFESYSVRIYPSEKITDREFTLELFLKGENLPLNGILMRNPFLDDEDAEFFGIMPKVSRYIDDLTDNLLILTRGKAFILPDIMVAYRVRKEITDDHNYNSINKALSSFEKHIELLNNIELYFEGQLDLFYRYRMVLFSGFKPAIQHKEIRKFRKVYNTIPVRYRRRNLLGSCIIMIPSKLVKRMNPN